MLGNKIQTINHNSYQSKLSLSTIHGFSVIEIAEIIYCRAYNNYTVFHLKDNKKICVSKSLTEYEILLNNNDFMRVHKSFLINLHHVKEYRRGEGGVVIMSNKEEIEISRRKKDQFLGKAKTVFKF